MKNHATSPQRGIIATWLRAAQRLAMAVMTAVATPAAAQDAAAADAAAPTATSTAAKATTAPTASCTQTWTYDSEGNVLTQVDRRGLATVNTYDRENRLRTQAKAGLLLQTRGYDADGNLRQQTDALGRHASDRRMSKRRHYDGTIAPPARDPSGVKIVSFSSVPEP